jgi:CHAT domain-containing protein/Tfp pilus assembly protein PilF
MTKGVGMKKYEFFLQELFLRPLIILVRCFPTILLVFIFILIMACAEKRMTVDEAKKATVFMGQELFAPPPRRINDILALLAESGQFDQTVTNKFKAKADKFPPEGSNNRNLAYFYRERGQAALMLYRNKQALEDFRKAMHYAEKAKIRDAFFANRLGVVEMWAGNYNRALELFEQSLRIKKGTNTYYNLVIIYSSIGDLESAENLKREGIYISRQSSSVMSRIFSASMRAFVLEAQGKHVEAEKQWRKILSLANSIKKQYPVHAIDNRTWLAANLMEQNRFVEAELEARRVVKEVIGLTGKDSDATGRAIVRLGEILQKQGRLGEAEKLIKTGISILENSGLPSDSYLMGHSRMLYGNVLTDQNYFAEAMKEFDLAKTSLLKNNFLYEKVFARNPNLILSLLKSGRTGEAMQLIDAAYYIYNKNLGERHSWTAEIIGLRGIANVEMKSFKQATDDFSRSISVLLSNRIASEDDYSFKMRFKIIIEAYIKLLVQLRGSLLEDELLIDAAAETFRLADAIRNYTLRSALGASVARAAVVDPNLSDLVRREQDASKQIQVLQSQLTVVLAIPESQRPPDAIERLTLKIETLNQARLVLLKEIKKDFPKYSELTDPVPADMPSLQEYLRTGEVMISIYSSNDSTFVWAIPPRGEVRFEVIRLGKIKLTQIVDNLRQALNPDPETFGDIPEFDVGLAYRLYNLLLEPVEKALENATDLLIVAHGPLGQLPFSVLPTASVSLGPEKGELFSNYSSVPWLIRKVSINRLPSTSSLIALRTIPKGDPSRRAFAGFGDPFFNPEQFAQAKKQKVVHQVIDASQSERFHLRGIRIAESGNLDSEKITSVHLGLLNRLPDTAEEIRSIAEALDADPIKDIFIGESASERQVKTMDLTDRRIIAFATHALVPGDLDGLDQPALALCAPSVTGDTEDGLLTMGEIMKLKMNADWVVLSACNTGAADGAGAEALSGLGRAFFYAGTRAILVSMWPVETTSARKLTTGLFRFQKEDTKLSRAGALRKTMLALIDNEGLKDHATGKIIASYGHPLFWAPFIIVGDSGFDLN